jgi:hypothetical protein
VVTQLYRVVVRNLANQTIAANASFYLTTVVDTDGDGLPDFWENEHQLSPANPNDRATDTDGDGMTSWEEYIAGTDSTDPQSQMRAVVSTAPSPVTLSFSASSNRTYTVEYRDEVGLTPWSKLADLVARPVDHVEELTDPAGNTNRFYRLVTPRQP